MIATITGEVTHNSGTHLVISVGGVGILVHVTAPVAITFPVGKIASLITTLIVREDALTLYGFATREDKETFELLQTVSGIGPRVAAALLSFYSSDDIAHAITTGEVSLLEKVPGIGKKVAQRMVLELKEKFKTSGSAQSPSLSSWSAWKGQLHSALTGLGYSSKEADLSIQSLVTARGDSAAESSLADLLKFALTQNAGKRGDKK